MTLRGEAPAHDSDHLSQQPVEGKGRGVERGSRGHDSTPRRLPFPVVVGLMLLALPMLFLAGWWGYRFAVSWLGPFAPLAVAFVGAIALATIGPALLVRYGTQLRAVVVHGATWLWAKVEATGVLQRIAARYPRLSRFLAARIAWGSATGLSLTIGLVALVVIGQVFLDLLLDVVTDSQVAGTDRRILHLIETLRTPELDQIMYALTYLGSVRVVLTLAAVVAIVALLAGRYTDAVLLFLALAASELFVQATKLLVARPRPPLEDARIVQTGFSFPSGHAALAAAFYGTAAYLLARGARWSALKVFVGSAAALLVVGIGISRIYLGVHYPTDVLAGWTLGVFWLAVIVLTEHVWAVRAHFHLPRLPVRLPRAVIVAVAGVLTLVSVGYLAITYADIPPPLPEAAQTTTVIAPAEVETTVETRLPHYTEGLTGRLQEPVSLVFVGTRAQLEQSFHAAGWTEAQPFGFNAVLGGISAALGQRGDPAGPVTPSFLADEPNALAFNLPVGDTFAQRHHVRIWSTSVQTSDGQPIWLATASFDQGFELAHNTWLPTHQIAPNVDTERAFVVSSLQTAGDVAQSDTIQLVPAEFGYNFDGDPFFTDGQAVLITLPTAL
jgi:membrane-associated phospholipid phosphatase